MHVRHVNEQKCNKVHQIFTERGICGASICGELSWNALIKCRRKKKSFLILSAGSDW